MTPTPECYRPDLNHKRNLMSSMNSLLVPVCSGHKKALVEILGRIRTRDWLKRYLEERC